MAMLNGTTQITPGPDLVFIGPITAESMVKKTMALAREIIDELISTTLPPLPEPRDMNIAPTINPDPPAESGPPESFVIAADKYARNMVIPASVQEHSGDGGSPKRAPLVERQKQGD